MLTQYIIVPNPSQNCIDLQGAATEVCFPAATSCDRIDQKGVLVTCEDRWNCNLERHKRAFYMPVQRGEMICIQAQFRDNYNQDPNNLTNGWGTFIKATVVYDGGTETDHTLFASDYVVGNKDGQSYQNIILDTSLPFWNDKTCFFIHFEVFNQDDILVRDDICTEEYYIENACERSTVLIPEFDDEFDCFGNYYGDFDSFIGTSNFSYNSCGIRIPGTIKDNGYSVTKEVSGSIVSSRENQCIYEFCLGSEVPSYFMNMIIGQIIGSDRAKDEDGKYYEVPDSFNVTGRISKLQMFIFTFPLYETCKLENCN